LSYRGSSNFLTFFFPFVNLIFRQNKKPSIWVSSE